MQPNRLESENAAIPELDGRPVDESDNDAPGIMLSTVSSMPRAEDDDETFANSPEFHDQKAPAQASLNTPRTSAVGGSVGTAPGRSSVEGPAAVFTS